MSDLISRKEAIDAIRKDMYADKDYMSAMICDGIAEVLNELPAADAVPVIRCKDCKYNRNPPNAGNALCDQFYGMTDQNGFCHFGERRTDGAAD